MDLGGMPEGNDISGDEGVISNGVHHDPLNENLEETWSALGEQDVRSGTDSDPGMLPPPISGLPSTLGSIMGRTIEHQRMSELSILAPNQAITAANINQGDIEGIFADFMAGRRKLKQLEEIQNPKIVQAGFRVFGRKGSGAEEEEAVLNMIPKRKPSKQSQNENEATKSQPSKGGGSSVEKEEEVHLDLFFQTMYKLTKKLSLMKQIQLRREIRQLVMNAEKQEQLANRQKSESGLTETKKKNRFSSAKWLT